MSGDDRGSTKSYVVGLASIAVLLLSVALPHPFGVFTLPIGVVAALSAYLAILVCIPDASQRWSRRAVMPVAGVLGLGVLLSLVWLVSPGSLLTHRSGFLMGMAAGLIVFALFALFRAR